MQIREITLQELQTVYEVVCEGYETLTYEMFEDLIYDMRHMEYKMIGIFEKEELLCYAGVAIQTTLKHQRHLKVFELITRKSVQKQGYAKMMMEYLVDYAKMGMCGCVMVACYTPFVSDGCEEFLHKLGYSTTDRIYSKMV
jgi:GNAT superfamily N-acetyltransferase